MAKKAGMATGVEVARISVKVSPDTKQFRSELQRELNAIEQSVKGDIEVNAHLDPAQAIADFERMMAKLKAQGAKGVKVNANVSQNGGVGGAGGKGGGTADEVEELTRLQKIMEAMKGTGPNFGTGINPSGWVLILVTVMGFLAPIAGLLTGLLLTIPGLIALIATPIGALMLGLDGLKKAAESLQKPFEELKAVMSAAVQDQFTPIFEKLGKVFPTLKETLPIVSKGVASLFDSFTSAITSDEGLARIKETILNIGLALQAAAPGVGSLTGAMTKLAQTFTGGPLQGLVGWFNGAMASFDKWVTKAQESGELELIFNRVGEALRMIMDGLGKIAAIGLDVLTDPQKWESFKALFQTVIDIIVWFFSASASFLEWLSRTATTVEMVWNTIKAAVMAVPNAIGEAFSRVVGFVQNVVTTVSGVISQLPTIISGVWGMIVTAAQGAWSGLVGVVQNAWTAAVAAVQAGIDQVVSFVSELPGKVTAALASLASAGIEAGKALVQGLINGIGSLVGSAIAKARELASSVAGAVKGFLGINSPSKVFTEYGQNTAQGFANGIADGTKSAVEAAKDLANQVKKAMDSGADGSSILGDIKPEDLKTLIAAIEEEKKRLKIMKNDQFTKEGKASVQQQIDALQAQKDILSYQRDRVKNQEDLNEAGGDDPFVKAASGLMTAPVDFATATGKQFMSDLGISGDGFISKGITEGIKYIFNIGSVDEAMSLKEREDSKQARAATGR